MDKKFYNLLERKYGINLNEQQRKAAEHKDGPAVILAVPGAGKTTVMIIRTANLILNYGIRPENILSVTFSKASALDMQNRFQQLFGGLIKEGINFSTIHSFAYFLLRDFIGNSGKKLMLIEGDNNQVNKAGLLKKIYHSVNDTYLNDDKLEDLISSISYVKNMKLERKDFKNDSFGIDNFGDIYEQYEKNKRANGYIDFDDMLTLSYEILISNPAILNRYRSRYKYIQVDEGQDTSKIQHEIIKLITKPLNNIFLVGDEDQSIYGFRGAYPDAILKFEEDYGRAKVFFMEENFRSTKKIVSAAGEFIKTNKERYNKNIFTNREEGKEIQVKMLKDENEQISYIVESLKSSFNLQDTAIVYRNNISAIPVADALNRCGIPFYLRDSKQNFFNHWVVLDIIAFLNLSLWNDNIESFERIYYKMNSYVPKKALEFIKGHNLGESVFGMLRNYPGLNSYQVKRIDTLKECFIHLSGMKPRKAIEYIEKELFYKEYLRDNCERLGYSFENLNLILANLKSIAVNTDNIENFINRLEELQSVMDKAKFNKGKEAVTLSTVHSCKGLEFEKVYMIDLIEGQFPAAGSSENSSSNKDKEMEEERRLFYVGMTRAKNELCLIVINNKNNESVVCSRFVGEIYSIVNPDDGKDSLENKINSMKEGSIIIHKSFGRGEIISISGNVIAIDFDAYGIKNLLLDTCINKKLLYVDSF